jgi:DNA-binding PadR family transcriptional regulator
MERSLAERRVEAYRMGRKRRGDIRIFLLWSLAVRPMHGYELIQFLTEKTHGLWTPSPGSVYPTLEMLEDQGLVTSKEKDGKRTYSITEAGRELAAKLPKGSFVDDPEQSEAIGNLREANMLIRRMMQRIVTQGSIEDMQKAANIMRTARGQLMELMEIGGEEENN